MTLVTKYVCKYADDIISKIEVKVDCTMIYSIGYPCESADASIYKSRTFYSYRESAVSSEISFSVKWMGKLTIGAAMLTFIFPGPCTDRMEKYSTKLIGYGRVKTYCEH